MSVLTPLETRILDDWQRDFPMEPRPFDVMAQKLEVPLDEVLAQLRNLQANGTVARVGATCRPNTMGASTLAALAVPEWRVEEVAGIVGSERGVNHSYLRENEWNLWFVATAPDAADLAATLRRIEERSGLEVLALPLKRAFNIDLGFALEGPRHALQPDTPPDLSVITEKDRALMQALTNGLPLLEQPYAALGARLGMSTQEVIARVRILTEARIITRMGVIVRHRALGWRSNAMVVWNLPDEKIGAAGQALLRVPGVTLCYERTRVAGKWDYPLFCMIHAKSRSEAMQVLETAAALPEMAGAEKQVLFSIRCFKQTGAMLDRPREVHAA
ncbi:Lrp/AsnC family transcriptional regulator [Thioclava sp. A2]|uniref:siroheme decarboxylase subunit beta n=1 Tax=Thioclava sp. FCG-A2 TaxID=3080562 RepID=UPI002953FD33|nr:Lrp/AsnC family transcriptional regulator [Thioclava sp. A2]MDV7270893.1 Lrp/AsnC family transcriptional regulator [Thioclava sp. A2]